MAQIKGRVLKYKPRLSKKTPVGAKLDGKVVEGNKIDLTIIEIRDEEEERYVNERLVLEVEKGTEDYFELDSIPRHLRKTVPRSTGWAVFEIHKIHRAGRTETVEPVDEQVWPQDREKDDTQSAASPTASYSRPPSRELLESITADVLDSLGYQTETNVSRDTREDTTAEVDVWAENPRANFSIYVSCKNWDSKVGRQTVDEEIGRIINLRKVPQLRVMVVGELTSDAEKALEANGFVAVVLNDQADEENADEIYREIHTQLTETLLAIAPPNVEEIAGRAEQLSRELAGLSDEIRQIGD